MSRLRHIQCETIRQRHDCLVYVAPTRCGDSEPLLAVTAAVPDDAVRLYDANSGSGNVGMYQLITPIHTPYSATLAVVRVSIVDTPAEKLRSDRCRPHNTTKCLPCDRRTTRRLDEAVSQEVVTCVTDCRVRTHDEVGQTHINVGCIMTQIRPGRSNQHCSHRLMV